MLATSDYAAIHKPLKSGHWDWSLFGEEFPDWEDQRALVFGAVVDKRQNKMLLQTHELEKLKAKCEELWGDGGLTNGAVSFHSQKI